MIEAIGRCIDTCLMLFMLLQVVVFGIIGIFLGWAAVYTLVEGVVNAYS